MASAATDKNFSSIPTFTRLCNRSEVQQRFSHRGSTLFASTRQTTPQLPSQTDGGNLQQGFPSPCMAWCRGRQECPCNESVVINLFCIDILQGRYIVLLGIDRAGIPPADDNDWKALESLFSRKWWTRMWVVQEICVSQHALFICGSATIDSKSLFQACTFINQSAVSVTTGVSTGSSSYLSALHKRRASGGTSDLLRLLIDTRSFAVSNHRDKIYALLGLCSAREALSTPVDYERPKTEVYRSLAMSLMRTGSLDILTAVSDPYWRDVSFTPSWVPDWSLVPQVTELLRPSDPISASAS